MADRVLISICNVADTQLALVGRIEPLLKAFAVGRRIGSYLAPASMTTDPTVMRATWRRAGRSPEAGVAALKRTWNC